MVTAHMCDRNASSESKPSASVASTWSTVWKTPSVRLNQSLADYLSQTLAPGNPRLIVAVDVRAHRQFRLFFARIQQLTNVVIPCSGSPVCCAVPAIGQVSMRRPSMRTNISGDAPNQLFLAQLQKNS